MTNQPTLPPYAHTVPMHVRRLPAEVTRWLLQVSSVPATPEAVTALAVNDGEFEVIVMPRQAWNQVREVLNAPHRDRWRAAYQDAGAPAVEANTDAP